MCRLCRLIINLKNATFQECMRKKMAFQYRYYIYAVENITFFSYLGSSFRESTNCIAANDVLLNFQGLLMTLTPWGYEEINPSTYMIVSQT